MKRITVLLVVLATSLSLVGTAIAIDRAQARAEARAEAYTMVLGPGWRLGRTDIVGVALNNPGHPQWHGEFLITRTGYGRTEICSGSFDITQYGHIVNRKISCGPSLEN